MSFRLETERLIVRPPEEGDAPAMHEIIRDPDMMRYLNEGEPMPVAWVAEARERQLGNLAEFGFCVGTVLSRTSGEVLGISGLQPQRLTGEIELAWWIRKQDWGRGYATEAAREAIRYGFEEAGLDRIVSVADPENGASIAVMRKIGLRDEGTRIASELEARYPNTEVAYYALDREDWRNV